MHDAFSVKATQFPFICFIYVTRTHLCYLLARLVHSREPGGQG